MIEIFYKNLIFYYNSNTDLEVTEKFAFDNLYSFFQGLKNDNSNLNQSEYLNRLVLLGDKDFFDLKDSEEKEELIKLILALKKNYIFQKMKRAEQDIAEAERNNDAKIDDLMREFSLLSRELKDLE